MEIWMRMTLVASLRDCKVLNDLLMLTRSDGSAMRSWKRAEVYDGFKDRRLIGYCILLISLEVGGTGVNEDNS